MPQLQPLGVAWLVHTPIHHRVAFSSNERGSGSPLSMRLRCPPTSSPHVRLCIWVSAFGRSYLLLLTLALLAFRIWQINSRVRNNGGSGSTLMPVLLIIIDAGLLYSVTLLSALLCFVNHSNGQYVVLDLVSACSPFLPPPLKSSALTSCSCLWC